MRSRFALIAFFLTASLLCFAFSGDGKWLTHVPDRDRTMKNPLAADHDAAAAGAKLFARHCAECHGENGEGKHGHPALVAKLFARHCAECHGENGEGKHGHPALVSARIRHASDGEIQWLLRNGSLRNGMPSWSSLPIEQRWQLIAHIRTLEQSAQVAQMMH